ncbi:MAG: proteasome accessory factor PafA2 family protein [Candidatus Saccharimonadales bacterium]
MFEKPFQQVYGTEFEWPMAERLDGKKHFDQVKASSNSEDFLETYLLEGLINNGRNRGSFLSNGSRYYSDVGEKVEYATPEDTSIMGVVVSELAGERIAAESLRRYIVDHENIANVKMFKRAVDDKRETWGYHINVSEDRTKIINIPEDTKAVVAHLATSQAILGGGAVFRDLKTKEYGYSFGQKVLAPINHDYDVGTTLCTKPFVNLRDEPLADKEKFWRIHVVGVDPHISTWASWMSIGTIGLMLAASRQGKAKDLSVAGATAPAANLAVHASTDLEMRNYYKMSDGGRYTSLDIQAKCIDVARHVSDRTEEQDTILEEWERAHHVLSTNPMSLMESDAIAKLALIRGNLERRNKEKMDEKSAEIDLEYTEVFSATKDQANKLTTDQLFESSFPYKIRQKYGRQAYVSSNQIHYAMYNPPIKTRAAKRAEIVKNGAFEVNWHEYNYKGDKKISLGEAINSD